MKLKRTFFYITMLSICWTLGSLVTVFNYHHNGKTRERIVSKTFRQNGEVAEQTPKRFKEKDFVFNEIVLKASLHRPPRRNFSKIFNDVFHNGMNRFRRKRIALNMYNDKRNTNLRNYDSKAFENKDMHIYRKPFQQFLNKPPYRVAGDMPYKYNGGNNKEIAGSEDHYMICPDPLGRLGNQMFELASAVGIASTLGYKFVIKPSHPLLEYFDIKQVSNIRFVNVLDITEIQWRRQSWRQSKTYLSYNLTTQGYFQAFDFFQNVYNDIRKTFTIKPEYVAPAVSFLRENIPAVKTLVGVHVRRGDFLSAKDIKRGKVVADRYYIKKAMDFYKHLYPDSFFVVVSNDKRWCKSNIEGDNVLFSDFESPIIDMAIMSLCDHSVITAGSFSWWAGWLAGGKVVYLKDFPRPGSKIDRSHIRRERYYLPEWIGMSNGFS